MAVKSKLNAWRKEEALKKAEGIQRRVETIMRAEPGSGNRNGCRAWSYENTGGERKTLTAG